MATLSRFVVIDVEPLDIATEEKLLLDRYQSAIAKKLVIGADAARGEKRNGNTTVFVSTRDLELAARLHAEGIPEKEAIAVAIVGKSQNDTDRRILGNCFDVSVSEGKKSILDELAELKEENKKLKEKDDGFAELSRLVQELKASNAGLKAARTRAEKTAS